MSKLLILNPKAWFGLLASLLCLLFVFIKQGENLIPASSSVELFYIIPQLIFALLVFLAIGWCLQKRVTRSLPPISFLHIALGQVALIIYLFLQSGLVTLISKLTGFKIDLNAYDLTLIAFGYLFFEFRKDDTRREFLKALKDSTLSLIFFFIFVGIFASRELPRVIMLSTDPDQHLYFTMRILFSGSIPWSQDSIGPLSFEYPAGLAALVASWVRVSFLEASSALTIQPIIQAMIGVLICVEAALTRFGSKEYRFVGYGAVISLFLTSFPLTLENGFYHLEGTGRISSWSFSALVMVIALTFDKRLLPFASLGMVILASLNPSLPIIPGLFLLFRIIYLCFEPLKLKDKLIILSLSFSAGCAVFFDPYYFSILSSLLAKSQNSLSTSEVAQQFLFNFVEAWSSTLLILENKFLGSNSITIQTILFISSIFILFFRRSYKAVVVLLLPILAVYLGALLSPFLNSSVASVKGGFLFGGYFQGAMNQIGLLWFFAQVGVVLSLIISNPVICFFISASLIFVNPILEAHRDSLKLVNMSPRKDYCGCCGCFMKDDEEVMRFMEKQYKEYVDSDRPLDHKSVPKILVSNAPVFVNGEEWLFPVGTSRILPIYETFPLAFYYFQGSKDYSYKNYQSYVCKRLDMQWLKDRNIRYLFIPSQGEGCIRRISELKENVIFKSGNASLVRIF